MYATTKCLIKLGTHHCHITITPEYISVFKYNNSTCDMYVFTTEEQFEASDYIVTPLPTMRFSVTFPNEQ
jgi:hypothetical protein